MVDMDVSLKDASPNTRAVHAGREDFVEQGLHAPPIDLSTTYPVADLNQASASLEALAEGKKSADNPVYTRLHNPTVARFETALAHMERADAAVAFGSGMAAVTACLLAARQDGKHVVALRPLYGGTDHLLDSGLLGFDVTWATPATVADALRPNTSLVIIETPANPTLKLVDIRAIADEAGSVPVLVDSTFAPPVLQQPLQQGATLSLHSATKFLGGHGDVIAGTVATSKEWAERLRHVRVATGALLHPWAAYLLHRSLPTLPARIERAQTTAEELIRRLSTHDFVSQVYYPGWNDAETATLRDRQMKGPGTMISFEVQGGYEAAQQVMGSVDLITPAVSLGSVDTLIQHPVSLTHYTVDPDARAASEISDSMLRLSVGLEGVGDLWHDLNRALDAAASVSAEAALPG